MEQKSNLYKNKELWEKMGRKYEGGGMVGEVIHI